MQNHKTSKDRKRFLQFITEFVKGNNFGSYKTCIFFSSQSGRLLLFFKLYLSVCVSIVCSGFKACISVTMSRILMKLGESVGTEVPMIVTQVTEFLYDSGTL